MTILLEKVLAQVSQLPETEQNAVAVRLLQTLVEFDEAKPQENEKPRPQFGSAKGLGYMTEDFEEPTTGFQEEKAPKRRAGTAKGAYWMSEDFDAPLEDFKEYM